MSTGGHALECPEQDAQCPQACGAVAPRRALAEHVDRVCPLSLVSCTLPGCDQTPLRRDLAQHLSDTSHLAPLIDLVGRLSGRLAELEAIQGGFVFRSGKTVAGEGWEHYSTGGIFINVDTTAAGFTSDDVTYTTSMMGTSSHWMSTGSSCVYPWPGRTYRTGFRVYIYQASLTVAQAREYGYQVSWVGQERR